MFDNLLGQDEVKSALTADLAGNRLPPALLLSGPPGSGKLTAALEIARALSCAKGNKPQDGKEEHAAWNCGCQACVRHRVLAHPDFLILGKRSFPEEMMAALELLKRFPGPASSYFFVRAARKLSRRFDPVLYSGEESRLSKSIALVRDLEELLGQMAPEKARQGELASGAMEAAEKAAQTAEKLEAFVPDAPPVFMIRGLESWAYLAPLGPRKTVIIENADRMQESSRNALLKILEEPPESLRFVLTTARRRAVMTTILSRTRTYTFCAREAAGTAAVIEKVFRSNEPCASVEEYLAARRAFPPAVARKHAESFLGAALARREDRDLQAPALRGLADLAPEGPRALASLAEDSKDFGQKDEAFAASFNSFLGALAEVLANCLADCADDAYSVALIEKMATLGRAALAEYESLNRSPNQLVESLLFALGEARIGA